MAGYTDKIWPQFLRFPKVGDIVEYYWADPHSGGAATGQVVQVMGGCWVLVLWENSNCRDKRVGERTTVKEGWLLASPHWDIYGPDGESIKDFKDYPKGDEW